jgi:putative salt-induced outer membrane protein YdiY
MAPRMNSLTLLFRLLGITSLLSVTLVADVVITNDGSRLVGEVVGMEDGNLTLLTKYAGSVRVSLLEITSIQTENPAYLRLEDNRTIEGIVAPADAGKLNVGVPPVLVALANLQHIWRESEQDPVTIGKDKLAKANRMKWKHSMGFDLTGSSGNTEDFGLGLRADSTYGNKFRAVDLYLSYNNSHKEDVTIVDETKGGAEYASQFSDHLGWYAKTDLESDRLEEIDIRATVASGLKYILWNENDRTLSLRAGAAFRYEAYQEGSANDLDDPAIDFGLEHSRRFSDLLSVETDVTMVPSITDFSNYLLTQDSALVVPLGKESPWKLRSGLANSYNSTPAPGKEGLDLKYYIRLVYSWE